MPRVGLQPAFTCAGEEALAHPLGRTHTNSHTHWHNFRLRLFGAAMKRQHFLCSITPFILGTEYMQEIVKGPERFSVVRLSASIPTPHVHAIRPAPRRVSESHCLPYAHDAHQNR
jgi:hypothetical protein